MEDLRSRSYAYGDGRMQIEPYSAEGIRDGHLHPPAPGVYDTRCYSASYASGRAKEASGKQKGKGGSSGWSLSDPEFQRKKRVASYKVYAVEGKVKGSLKKSFRWLKDRYTNAVYGWW